MGKLITTSLINSVQWLQNCPPGWKTKAYEDLKNSLNRVYSDVMPDPIKFGLDFENKVEIDCHKLQHMPDYAVSGSEKYLEVIDRVKNGKFQVKCKKMLFIDNIEYCLYGKIDVAFDDVLIDLKTTGKYSFGKYLKTTQHLLYCYITGVNKFKYIIVVWDEYPKIKELHYETFIMENVEKVEDLIIKNVRSTMVFINKDPVLREAYNSTFCK